MKIILDYNRTIFNPETDDLYPDVLDLLIKISKNHELFLISRNEPQRRERLKDFDIANYFKQILFVDNKSYEVFEEIAGESKNVFVVGDSISDEIKIGNQLGLITIRIKQGKFAKDMPRENDERAKFEIANISELEKIISIYEN